jgi:signal transduction histidine kinase
LDLAKTNFIATISHELKTPISSIKMSSQLLEDKRIGETNEEQEKLIGHIKEDAVRLLKITSELLDLAQVETGNIQLQKQSIEPKAVVDYAYDALKFQAEQKHIAIEVHIEPNLPKVACDLEKTAWVMVNFLSNAIRHSPDKSKVAIHVSRENNSVIFSVKDSGKGIDAKYKSKVFEKFFKIPSMETGKSGTGLGLAISKDFISAQGGRIWVESQIGEGSTFSFSLNV